MDGGLLSLKWNNHRSTFLHVLSTVRHKESYCDVTIACDGKFYPVHKLVLSTCSEYFEQMFERTNCKHPIIVLKDIKKEDLEALLNYMYVGEVNVLQNNLSGLIKAAEGLRIKGLAVPDESPSDVDTAQESKRSVPWGADGPETKRRRPEEQSPASQRGSHTSGDKGGRERSPGNYREPFRILPRSREPPRGAASPSSVPVSRSPESHLPNASLLEPSPDLLHPPAHDQGASTQAASSNESTNSSNESAGTTEMKVDEPLVKEEPQETYGDSEETKETLQSADSDPGINYSQHTAGLVGEAASGSFTPQGLRTTNQPQTLEELVALPGASGLQGKSLWESDRGLLGMPFEGYSTNQARTSQLGQSGIAGTPGTVGDQFVHGELLEAQKTHCCTYCHKIFDCRQKLVVHLRTHTGEKPFACQFCPYRSAQKGNLQLHIRTHTGEEPFACSHCPYRTKNQSNLATHIRNKHLTPEVNHL